MIEQAAVPVRALLVDDELPGRINLRYALADHPNWQLIGECCSAAEAREQLAMRPVDVVFLDIHMPRETGLDLAREISQRPVPPVIIFVTAYERFAIEAFEVHALDYLLKPFDDQRLAQALARAQAILSLRQGAYKLALRDYVAAATPEFTTPTYLQRLSVRSVGMIESVDLAEVLWLRASGNYVELHLANRTVLHRVTLSHLEQRLDPTVFMRVHRSALVRREQLVRLTVTGDGTYLLDLRCGEQVAVSERFVQAVRTALDS